MTTPEGRSFAGGIQRLEAFRYQIEVINANLDWLASFKLIYSIFDSQEYTSAAFSAAINALSLGIPSVVGTRDYTTMETC